jgi:hypothetical protein
MKLYEVCIAGNEREAKNGAALFALLLSHPITTGLTPETTVTSGVVYAHRWQMEGWTEQSDDVPEEDFTPIPVGFLLISRPVQGVR